jgi:hypothetical protein
VVRDAGQFERDGPAAQRARHRSTVNLELGGGPRVDAARAVLHLQDAGVRVAQLAQRERRLRGQLRQDHVWLGLFGDRARVERGLGFLAVLRALQFQSRVPDRVGLLLDLGANLSHAVGELRARDASGCTDRVEHDFEFGGKLTAVRLDARGAIGGAELVPRRAARFLLRRRDGARVGPGTVDGAVLDGQVIAGHALGQHAALAVGDRAAHRGQQRAAVHAALGHRQRLRAAHDRQAEEPGGHHADHQRHRHADPQHPALEHRGRPRGGRLGSGVGGHWSS